MSTIELDLPDLHRPAGYRLREYDLDESDAIFRAVSKAWGRSIADALAQALGSYFLALEEEGGDPGTALAVAVSKLADSYSIGVVVEAVGAAGIASMFRFVAAGHLIRLEPGANPGDPDREVEVLPKAESAQKAHAATEGGIARYYSGGRGLADAAVLTFACLGEALGPLGRALVGAGRGFLPGRKQSPTPEAPERT